MKKFLIRLLVIPAFVVGIISFIPYWIITGKDMTTTWIAWFEAKLKSND